MQIRLGSRAKGSHRVQGRSYIPLEGTLHKDQTLNSKPLCSKTSDVLNLVNSGLVAMTSGTMQSSMRGAIPVKNGSHLPLV